MLKVKEWYMENLGSRPYKLLTSDEETIKAKIKELKSFGF